jgi:hypothetical protein
MAVAMAANQASSMGQCCFAATMATNWPELAPACVSHLPAASSSLPARSLNCLCLCPRLRALHANLQPHPNLQHIAYCSCCAAKCSPLVNCGASMSVHCFQKSACGRLCVGQWQTPSFWHGPLGWWGCPTAAQRFQAGAALQHESQSAVTPRP